MTPTGASSAGQRILVIEHEGGAGLGLLAPALKGAGNPPIGLDVVRPAAGDRLPPDPVTAGYAGLIVLGGSMSGWDDADAPWLPATRRLLGRALARGTPTLGICLGAHLLVLAAGGQVARAQHPPALGVTEVTLLPPAVEDPLFGRASSIAGHRFRAIQRQQDDIVELPAGAVQLAAGERYAVQAVRIGEAAWGLQYHPEATVRDLEQWQHEQEWAPVIQYSAARAHRPGITATRERDLLVRREPAPGAPGQHEPDLSLELELARVAEAHARAFAAVVAT